MPCCRSMEPFLKHTAKHLWEQHEEQLSDVTIVFPNKRSALYFTKYLKSFASDFFVIPECLTINEFFISQSDKVIPDKLTLSSKLYESYSKVINTPELFSEFYPFSNLLLGDFDTIDKHLVDTQQLFQNLASLQSIDNTLSYLSEEQLVAIQQFWKSFDIAKHSKQQLFFLEMWKALPSVYNDFNKDLEQEGLAYEGRVFREVVEDLQRGGTTLTDQITVFVGFNVLSKAERELFSLLKKENKAFFYWDYDNYFVENKNNEAGRFIRKHIADFPNAPNFLQEEKIDANKEVVHLQCATEVQQAKVIGEMLSSLSSVELKNTAVILANEELLPTVLSSLPKSLEAVNISMGYPLKETAWMQFLELLFGLHNNTKWQNGVAFFASDDVQKVLQHSYLEYFEEQEVAILLATIRSQNKIWVASEAIPENLKTLFYPLQTGVECHLYLKNLLSLLFKKTEVHSADRELMVRTSTTAHHIQDTLQTISSYSVSFFWTLLLQDLKQQRMAFASTSEESLQIIGFLETRLLDFENVYILSANENYLPNIQLAGSLIPYNLRIGAGLPTLDEQNSMYAYYFYRLLGRTKKMTLFSVEGTEDMQCKEQSRYITQLQYEAPFAITEIAASATLEWIQPQPKTIEKGKEVLEVFDKYFEGKRTISASAINRYLRCPQNFYYRYIKGVEEVQTLAKADDSNMFGTIFHKAAELLYKPFEGELITENILDCIGTQENLDKIIEEAFRQELFAEQERVLRGKELLIFDTLKHFLLQLLTRDKGYAPFKLLGLEEKMQANLTVVVEGVNRTLVLKGLIDRIDEKDGVIRVVDYKTGYINRGFKSLKELFVSCGKDRNPTALQTFFYSWLFYKNTGEFPSPCVYHLKEIANEVVAEFKMGESRKKEHFIFEEHIEEYETLLKELLGEIFGNVSVFHPTEEATECAHDAHTGICTVFGG